MNFSFPGAFPNQRIQLSFDRDNFRVAGHILVYAFYEGKLILTHHKVRGWELPGGKCHRHEWAIQAATREVYEETGAELAGLSPIAQYRISEPQQPEQVKTIYVAEVYVLHPLPKGLETDAVELLNPAPNPKAILLDPEFSPLLKDAVYPLSLPVALTEIQRLIKKI